MVSRHHKRRRFKPGRYILLAVIIFTIIYNYSGSADVENMTEQKLDSNVVLNENHAPPQSTLESTNFKPSSENGNDEEVLSEHTSESEKGLLSEFSFMDEIEAVDSIDIHSIEKLNLVEDTAGYLFNCRLAFTNNNSFPVRIINSELVAILSIRPGSTLHLENIILRDVLIPKMKGDEPGSVIADVVVNHGKTLEDLHWILKEDFNSIKYESINLPLHIKGSMLVELQLLGELTINRSIELEFKYHPEIKTSLLTSFQKSLQDAGLSRKINL